MKKPHIHTITVFDADEIRLIKDREGNCVDIRVGEVTIHVFGVNGVPIISSETVMQAAERDQREGTRSTHSNFRPARIKG